MRPRTETNVLAVAQSDESWAGLTADSRQPTGRRLIGIARCVRKLSAVGCELLAYS